MSDTTTGLQTYDAMLGQTMTSVTAAVENDVMRFESESGWRFHFCHGTQDCCEKVRIVDICGDLSDLVGAPLVCAESNSSKDDVFEGERVWTFYRFATHRGTVTVRWLGESNGHYSTAVGFWAYPPYPPR
jgi:hypothetical protein